MYQYFATIPMKVKSHTLHPRPRMIHRIRQQQQQQQHVLFFKTIKVFQSIIVIITILISVQTIRHFSLLSSTNSLLYRVLYDESSRATTRSITQTATSSDVLVPNDPDLTSMTKYSNDVTIDMISVGSITRNEYQIQQERTFGTHPSIRHFYRVNELNDTSDQQCSQQLSSQQLKGITKFCNTQWDADDSTIRTMSRKRLKPFRYGKQSTGWLCAQKRPIDALQWLLQQYRTATSTTTTIPDYVVLIDDDTYMNMDSFLLGLQNYTLLQQQRHLVQATTSPIDFPILLSGCVFNFPRGLQFSFPHGGYGSIFSKATIQNLMRPIHCHYNNNNNMDDPINYANLDPFTRMACWRLYEQNHFNELQYFVDGMSVSDLMYNYTQSLSFLKVDSWENGDGFCFHSDHALGYFLGFYHVAIPDYVLLNAELSDNVRQQYQYGYSEISTTVNNADDDGSTAVIPMTETANSQCSNSYYEQCSRDDMICHYIQPGQMERMHHDNVYYEDEVKLKLQLRREKQQNESMAFDVISIGSLLKPQLQDAQERTFGSHPLIRHWFRINELNDTDTECSSALTTEHVTKIFVKCKTIHDGNDNADDETTMSEVSELIRRRLFNPKNHTGWMCAQKRPVDGLYKALQQYKAPPAWGRDHNGHANDTSSWSLPNYLVIIDDDTYVNMNYLMEALPLQYPSFESYIITGCRLIHPKRIQFSFPFGGFGTILSRRALENLLRPVYCDHQNAPSSQPPNDLFNTMACWRLKQNLFGEQVFFHDGMSVLDLMYAYSSGLMFTKVDEWKKGIDFCFHSDHALGYFFSFYHIAVTDEKWSSIELEMKNDPKRRINSYLNDRLRKSFTYTGLERDDINGCKYLGNKCTNSAPFCHYIEANHMETLYKTQMAIQ